jgi:cytochrome subunit of sulfide dehydrogenase
MSSRILLAAALATAPMSVHAQENTAARSLAATCASCHGTEGRSVTTEVAPLAGLPKELIVSQMKAFRDGTRPATVMQQLARGYTDQQIDLIAAYFAAQKK